MEKNTIFLNAIIAVSGTIQTESLNQRNAGNVTIHFHSKIQQNLRKYVQLEMQSQ